MARTTINSLGVPAGTITASDLTFPLADFSSTGIDDNASTTSLTIDSSGNISVTGTVDGRDLATDGTKLDNIEANADVTDTTNVTAAGALMDSELTDLAGVKGVTISTLQPKPSEGAFADGDKTKLDGIESGATADQTASEILTAIKTVDGTGSGLDADTLDGQEGTYYLNYNNFTNTPTIPTNNNQLTNGAGYLTSFDITTQTDPKYLRSNAADTATGTITISGLDQSLISQYNVNGNFWSGRIISSNTTTGVASFLGNYNGYAGVFAHNSALNAWAPIYINTLSTGNGAANVYLGTTYINGNTAWHAGNDGSGSGLDADTVDGIQGASFLRSDASDTASGQYTFTKVNDHAIRVGTIRGTVVGSQAGEYIHMYERVHIGSPSGWGSRNAPSTGLSTYGGADLATDTGSVTISGNTAWHAGNDGSGSGLDADTLDGVQGTNYFRCDGTYPNTDMNTTVEGYWHVASTASNLPVSYYGHRWDWDHLNNGQWVFQMYSPTSGTDDLWFRQKRNYSAQTWHKVWTTGNDGSGSGLDADTLDGQQGSYYQPASTAITTANIGSQSVSSASNIDGIGFTNTGSNSGTNADTIDSNGISYYTSGVTNFSGNATDGALYSQRYSSSWQHQIAGDYRSGQIALRGKNSGTWQSWRKVWDTGNDGSGSGLDADTLDGRQATGFFKSANGSVTGGTGTEGTLDTGNYNVSETGYSTQLLHFKGVGGSTPSIQIYGHYGDELYFRCGRDSETGWDSVGRYSKKIWHTANDGSGSGLDADTVDGVQASSMVQLTNTQEITGIKYFNGNRNTTSSNPPLQAYGTTSGAIMSFHRGGYFAVNFGLDSDNVMRIGGWSAAANRWQLDMSGNMTVAGNITAYSDIRLKENIKVIPNALEKVKQLRGVTFTRNDQEDKEARHTGVIAQEVEIVLPEVVAEDNDGVKNVAYGNMVGLLIEAIKEQQAQIEEQQAQIEKLKEIIKCQ